MRVSPAAVPVVAALSGAAVLAGPGWLAVPCGLLLGFVLPGLALTPALFRGRAPSRRALDGLERAVLAPALSLAVLVSAGLIVYAAGYALNRVSWTAATVGVTLVAWPAAGLLRAGAFARLVRRLRRRTPGRLSRRRARSRSTTRRRVVRGRTRRVRHLTPPTHESPVPPGRFARQLVPMVLVLAILGFAGRLSFADARRAAEVTVTALSATPPSPIAPEHRTAQLTRTVQVNASGLVAAEGPYSLLITAPHQDIFRRPVAAARDGTWSAYLPLSPERTTISLYRGADTTAYRTVYVAAEP